jgi:hypothetical protein
MKKLFLRSPNDDPFHTIITDENGEHLRYIKDISISISSEKCTQINVTFIGMAHEMAFLDQDMVIDNIKQLSKELNALGYMLVKKPTLVKQGLKQ